MNAPQSATYQHIVEGRTVAASTGETLPMIDPSTGAVFAHIAAGTADGRFADDLPSGGYWVKPTLFGPVPRDHALACDEVFGPVLAAMPFDDEANAIRLANATDFGLVGSVWTRDGDRQQRVAKRMRCGQVFINCYGAGGGVELPFGGVKKSGHGREKGFLALEHMSVTKTVIHRHG